MNLGTSESSQNRIKGKVKFWKELGWGFIVGEDGKDYFCHYSNVNFRGFKNLLADQAVSFMPVIGDKGPAAHFISVEL